MRTYSLHPGQGLEQYTRLGLTDRDLTDRMEKPASGGTCRTDVRGQRGGAVSASWGGGGGGWTRVAARTLDRPPPPPTAPAASSVRLPDTDSHSSLRLGSATATEPQSITGGRRPARSPSDEGDRSLSGPPAERGAAGRRSTPPGPATSYHLSHSVPGAALRGGGTAGVCHRRGLRTSLRRRPESVRGVRTLEYRGMEK